MVVVLDQGVRTWGDVRLVLEAAVLALGRQAARRGVPFFVATTAAGGEILDPLEADAETLGQRVEASDLSANPALALERVLESPADDPRDLVLLTHPRSLPEADVAAAARRLGARDRLFALTLDGHGAAELSELRRGAPVRLRQFHVDFTRSASRPVKPPPDSPADVPGPWRGDVEPVGYPFCFGVAGDARWFVFDRASEWLLVVAERGMLYACKTDGTRTQILPRGMFAGRALNSVLAAAGVPGGFVVAGSVRCPTAVFHYDLASQTCTRHIIPDVSITAPLHYLPQYHAVISATPSLRQGWALDLATGRCHRAEDTIDPAVRAAAAWGHCVSHGLPTASLSVMSEASGTQGAEIHVQAVGGRFCHVESSTGTVRFYGVPHWTPFTPQADGQPVLRHCEPLAAQCRGNTLALLTTGARQGPVLRLFRGPEGVPLASYPTDERHLVYQSTEFTLSEDGAWLARKVTPARVEVRRVTGDAPPVITVAGGFSGPPAIIVGWCALLIGSGKHHAHLLRWKTGALQTAHGRDGAALVADVPELRGYGEHGSADGVPEFLHYDRDRFALGASWNITAVADRYGQVALFTHAGRLVCMFFAFREHLAGWMPDGTRLGPAWLTGGPESPGAAEKFGRVLCEACGKRVRS
jgi:MoxR-vWA-beta-propeller ternary system domain bpX1